MRAVVLSCMVVVLSGCGFIPVKGPVTGKTYLYGFLTKEYWDEIKQDYINKNPHLENEIKSAILNGDLVQGMNSREAQVSLYPMNLFFNSSYHGAFGNQEIYEARHSGVGGRSGGSIFLYFNNNILTSWSVVRGY